MCYMEGRRVGVRELRQNLSKYLRRVERGERLEVTEHGRPVAVLAPLGEPESPLARLVAAGRVTPPRNDLLELLPPQGRTSTRTSAALLAERAERL
jgi:prevent-host-death family protein